MLSRLTPIARSAEKRSWSTVPGLASLVISASGAMSNASRQAARIWANRSEGSTVGVPPPMKMVRARDARAPRPRPGSPG